MTAAIGTIPLLHTQIRGRLKQLGGQREADRCDIGNPDEPAEQNKVSVTLRQQGRCYLSPSKNAKKGLELGSVILHILRACRRRGYSSGLSRRR